MAYNQGFPVTYAQAPQPVYLQPQPITPVQQAPQSQNNIIWVQGEAGEKSYLVAPNTTVPLWDSENQIIYLKSADAMGRPTVKILDYTIRDQESTQTPTPEYITKSDLEALEERLMKKLETRPYNNRKNYKEDRNDG